MSGTNRIYVCPAELAGTLDNTLRRFVHKPGKILEPYIRERMTVLDLGCGPGYFTTGIARPVVSVSRSVLVNIKDRSNLS